MHLTEIISQKIKEEGPISFRDYMEFCLYHPLGYYSSRRNKFGREGDFFTSPTISPIFGKLLVRQLIETWQILGKEKFTVVEWGGGNGALAKSILQSAKGNPDFYSSLEYIIIDRNISAKNSFANEKLKWYKDARFLAPFNGCVISNELVDNFPVHVVEMREGLKEVFVDCKGDKFIEVLVPAGEELSGYFDNLGIRLSEGFRAEVNLESRRWIKTVAATLNRGFVITFDYGAESRDLYTQRKSRGTLLCFRRHQVCENPYLHIGEQDITAHVNFSALMRWGEEFGFCVTGYLNQLNFLRPLGIHQYLGELEMHQENFPTVDERNWMLQHFIVEMGSRIKVLVQHKGVNRPTLSGLIFSNPVGVEMAL